MENTSRPFLPAMTIIVMAGLNLLGGCKFTPAPSLQRDFARVQYQCRADLAAPALAPIRNKLTLFRYPSDGPPSRLIVENTDTPSDTERQAILQWLLIRSECARREDASFRVPSGIDNRVGAFLRERYAGIRAIRGEVDSYIVLLSNDKVSYGEFELRHYELVHEATRLQSRLRHEYVRHNKYRVAAAKGAFNNLLAKWDAYMSRVSKRRTASHVPINADSLPPGTMNIHVS